MVDCTKCQKIIRREADGTKSEKTRCINGLTQTFRQTVTQESCDTCALKQIWDCQCVLNPPKLPIYQQPALGCDGEIIYSNGEPPCPYGYTPTDNSLVFIPKWPACSYLEFSNELHDDGSLRIKARCAITKKLMDPDTCMSCNGDITSITPKQYPAIAEELTTYIKAVKGWIFAGRPTRTDEEIAEIHSKYCTQCDWYDPEQTRCKGCGCATKAAGAALLNKIKMGTQHCPKQLW